MNFVLKISLYIASYERTAISRTLYRRLCRSSCDSSVLATERSSVIIRIPSAWEFLHFAYRRLHFILRCFLLFPFSCRPSHFLFYPQIISRQRQCTSDQCRDKTQDTGEHTAPTAYVYREYPSAYLSRFVEVFVKSRFGDFAVFGLKLYRSAARWLPKRLKETVAVPFDTVICL